MIFKDQSELRKAWQTFKSQNPTFEKARGYKPNFGPTLDQIVKLWDELKKAEDDLTAAKRKLIVVGTKIESACKIADTILHEHERVVKTCPADMQKDFADIRQKLQARLDMGINITYALDNKYDF